MPTGSRRKTDDQILRKLTRATRSGKQLTAEQLGGEECGVTAARLRNIEGVEVAGNRQTGKPGRPALTFVVTEAYLTRTGALSEQAASEESAEETGVPAREESV